ncbi:MAG: ribosome maturation factor RimP [Cyanobacteria bacterium P01_D01_bin.73]
MSHPLIPTIIDLATPVAKELGLDVVNASFHTNQSPPVLRLEVRNPDPDSDTSLENCEKMSRALEVELDEHESIPDAYVLEVSSPGLSIFLESDRDFTSFKGFAATVDLTEPHKGKRHWNGTLVGRDDDHVRISQKGRVVKLPRAIIQTVQLADGDEF